MRVVVITALCAAVALSGCSSGKEPKTQDDSGYRTPNPDEEEAPRWEGADGSEQTGPPRSASKHRALESHAGHAEPTATLPGFRMLSDGRSRVFLEVSGDNVQMTPRTSPGKLTYRFSNVRVPGRISRLPLLTTHFPTPVARIQLHQVDADAELVIELRAAVEPELHVEQGDGAMVISADFPRPEDIPPAAALSGAQPIPKPASKDGAQGG